MATSAHQLRNRTALKIVETDDVVVDSLEVLPEREPKAGEAGLNVPSSAGEFLEASVAEDGGTSRIGTRRGSQHQYRAVLHEAIVRVAGAIDSQGVCDANGRLRRSWLSELQGLIREARAIDQLLGLERQPEEPAGKRGKRNPVADPVKADPINKLPKEIEAFLDMMDEGE